MEIIERANDLRLRVVLKKLASFYLELVFALRRQSGHALVARTGGGLYPLLRENSMRALACPSAPRVERP